MVEDQVLPPLKNDIPALLTSSATKMAEKYKDMGGQVNKFTKTLDKVSPTSNSPHLLTPRKKFKLDIGLACDPKVFQGQDDILRRIVIHHFIRQGQFDLARVFSEVRFFS